MAESIIVKLYVISAVQRFGGFEKGKKVHFGKEFDKRIGTLLRKVNGSSSFCKGPRTSKV